MKNIYIYVYHVNNEELQESEQIS